VTAASQQGRLPPSGSSWRAGSPTAIDLKRRPRRATEGQQGAEWTSSAASLLRASFRMPEPGAVRKGHAALTQREAGFDK
jgi:hypothetical protein